ncbi:PucR family transcriptional regulator [Streptomyces sp. NPDC101175]|uniref:PucR family transcriptional regulator n=1 Tax=Streptomyces sp. NPDC101175 TaxID=3366123 RepID=UPI0038391A6C
MAGTGGTPGDPGSIASVLTSCRHTVVTAVVAAADRAVPAQTRITGTQRARYEASLNAVWSHVVDAFTEGGDVRKAGSRPLRETARICADHALTGDEILHVVRVGVRAALGHVLERCPPESVAGLMDFVSFCRPAVLALTHGAAAAYHPYLLERGRGVSDRELIGRALVCGSPADSAPTGLDPARFTPATVLLLSRRRHGDGSGEGAERVWRRVAERIEGDDVCWALVGDDLALVLPGAVDQHTADAVHRAAAQEAEAPLWTLVSPAVAMTEIRRTAADCQASMASVRRLDYPAGCYPTRSLLFERIVLSADPATLCQATWLIREAVADAKLADTLTAWIAHHGQRGDTAASLGIHPRTLDYRLRRIRALVGLDPTEPSAMSLLRCASIAWTADNTPDPAGRSPRPT